MITRRTGCITVGGLAFVTGVMAGVAAGVLLAPHSGAYTRRQLHDLVENVGERASCMAEGARQAVGGVIERGKRLVA